MGGVITTPRVNDSMGLVWVLGGGKKEEEKKEQPNWKANVKVSE